MKCYEIFSKLSPELTNQIFAYLLESEKPVYKAMIQNIATRRKLRPIFIERKPRNERHIWLQQALSLKSADDITMQLLQSDVVGALKGQRLLEPDMALVPRLSLNEDRA